MKKIQEKVLRVSCDWTFSFEDLPLKKESDKGKTVNDYKEIYFEFVCSYLEC